MKKSTKFIIALLVTVGALAITYRVVNQAPSKDLAADAQMQEIITSGGCLQCHSGSPDLPFYANWPVASGMVQKRCFSSSVVNSRRNARLSCFRHDRNG